MKPTCNDLYEDNSIYKSVYRVSQDSWRHGSYVTQVYYRSSDNTYWEAHYCLSTDGETNGLRENGATITQVEPFEQVVTSYRPVNISSVNKQFDTVYEQYKNKEHESSDPGYTDMIKDLLERR